MKKMFLFGILFVLFGWNKVQANECYRYHTTKEYQIKVDTPNVFLIEIERDPNGVSIVSYKRTLLKINSNNARFVMQDKDDKGIIVANTEGYFWVDEQIFSNPSITPVKLVDAKQVSETFGGDLFCISGKWQCLTYDNASKQIKRQEIAGFPTFPKVISTFDFKGNYLLKDKTSVYVYNENKKSVQKITDLEADAIVLKERDFYEDSFLYDHDTFYVINFNENRFENITADFKWLQLNKKFTEGLFINKVSGDYSFDFNDGAIWAYDKNKFRVNDKRVYFFPFKNTKYIPESGLYFHQNGYFRYSKRLIHPKNNMMDMSQVKNLNQLKLVADEIYYDGKSFYKYNYSFRKLEALAKNTGAFVLLNSEFYTNASTKSYGRKNRPFWLKDSKIIYANDNYEIRKEEPVQTKIKDLTLAYAFDKKLLIEDRIIDNIADFATIQFVGSTVEIVSSCENADTPVVVEYSYFFKDKSAVYIYTNKEGKMRRLAVSVSDFSPERMYKDYLK